MAEGRTEKGGPAGTGTLSRTGEEGAGVNGGTSRLKEELEEYIEARMSVMLQNVGHGLGDGARKLSDMSAGTLTSTATHAKDALADKTKGAAGKAKDAVTDKAKDVTEKAKEAVGKGQRKDPSGGSGKGFAIIEDVDVGVPVREAYNQWTQYEEFQRFAKGVVGVEQKDEVTTQWHVKVAKSNRRWRGTTTEQVPDERIAWTSEGDKGTTRGVVTFHPLGENLTKVLLVLEYFPKGLFEKVGGLFRSQGRRVRLDLKLYRTFVMMRGEATGGWRGEIRDGELQEPEEADEARDEEEEEEEEEEEDGAEGAEDRYDEDEEPEAEAENDDEEGEGEEGEDTDEYEDDEDQEPEGGYEDEEDEEPEVEEADEGRRKPRSRRSSEP
ncbi:SRPBCC family protein [Streptomyces sp. NBC_00104]|uniref:SRPBCC family protein n=1 Tax=Streptomyces sp. NBC_00104 TaxID=2903621 RepID=UPI00324ADACC